MATPSQRQDIFEWAFHGLFLIYFQSFSNNNCTIFTTNKCKNDSSSIHYWDSNSEPLRHEYTPLTTRTGLPLNLQHVVSSNIRPQLGTFDLPNMFDEKRIDQNRSNNSNNVFQSTLPSQIHLASFVFKSQS